MAVRDQFACRISENIELVEELVCSHESALYVTKIRRKLEGRWTFHGRLFDVLQSTILQLKLYSACQVLLSFAK